MILSRRLVKVNGNLKTLKNDKEYEGFLGHELSRKFMAEKTL